ncbi:3-isopropylmalate dehydrogenase (plasmid) [Buchnera aphidicola (Kurisakia onigurumii)]|uniref:3-isopropylmalate dehydrogenase n=1 Tax=Buchnera aphidicola TaxID=9 RepID=UPI0031B6B196
MKKKYNIAVLPGDGIGPEIMKQAYKIIKIINQKFPIVLNTQEYDVGGIAIDKFNNALPKDTIEGCKKSHAILFGSVGGNKWNHLPEEKRPEKASLLFLRKKFDLFLNIRPSKLESELFYLSPLRQDISKKGFDIMCIRELTGGIYFGKSEYDKSKEYAFDTENYFKNEIIRVAKKAFQLAQTRKKKIVSIDKANVLKTSILWRKTVDEISINFPEIKLSHMYIDNATMQLIRNPSKFDVILCSNLFGDILSDECAEISGSIGMLPSASINENNFGLYEPAGGSAPEIAGKNIANPIAQILSLSMLIRYSIGNIKIADLIDSSVKEALLKNFKTKDISRNGENYISTEDMGNIICKFLLKRI